MLISVIYYTSNGQDRESGVYPLKGKLEKHSSKHVQTALAANFKNLVITSPPDTLGFDSFYEKYTDAFGIPVISSGKVPDAALLVARDIVNFMLIKRMDVRRALIDKGARVLIMAHSEMETDLPERSNWKKPSKEDKRLTAYERNNYDKPNGIGSMTDKEYWNKRARGMGGTITSCAEENLLGYPNTRYYGENILVHEFSHNIMGALRQVDPNFIRELELAYQAVLVKGLYKDQYAINTVAEYWAEGTQWWFWSNFGFYDDQVSVESPEDLKIYDPVLYDLLAQVYHGHHIPADVYYSKNIPRN